MTQFILKCEATNREWTWNKLAGIDSKGRKLMDASVTARFGTMLKDGSFKSTNGNRQLTFRIEEVIYEME